MRNSIIDNVAALAVIGILAGVLGGLAVGIVTGRPPSASSSTSTTH
jgi:hypothetical protein